MAERLYDVSPEMTQWIDCDATGFTLRTQYRDTQKMLDHNQKLRAEAPKKFRQDGVDFHHVCSVPPELYEMLYRRLGRTPSAKELIALSQDRDFNKLKTREVRL